MKFFTKDNRYGAGLQGMYSALSHFALLLYNQLIQKLEVHLAIWIRPSIIKFPTLCAAFWFTPLTQFHCTSQIPETRDLEWRPVSSFRRTI